MKKCPTCDKEFADSMKFCQTDGTVLIDAAPPADPYKTVVADSSEIAAAIPPQLDPFKTMVASPPPKKAAEDDDLLQLPDESDNLKTMLVSHDELREELKGQDVPPLDLPPAAPTSYAPSAPLIEPKPAASDFSTPPVAVPKSNEPYSSPSSLGDSPSSGKESGVPKPSSPMSEIPSAPPSPFDSKPFDNDFSSQSPYGNKDNKPIPSPFQDSLPPVGFPSPPPPPSPVASPFDPAPPFKEPEPTFGTPLSDASSQSPFQPASPFGQPEPFQQSAPLESPGGWMPPPAPVSEWGNQELGANTPSPPAAGGQNQTLAIISLVCGILSIICCGWIIPGVAAVVLGFIAKSKADQNPNEYGGRGFALGGIITGGISLVLGIIVIILYLFTGVLAGLGNI